ncbi:MAG: hypothetical protein LBV51_00690 [Acholeplasmatales bacterium]|jgi:hypothetical protein|nr:hypothetical protein [Acholeplasmatales bacterium]
MNHDDYDSSNDILEDELIRYKISFVDENGHLPFECHEEGTLENAIRDGEQTLERYKEFKAFKIERLNLRKNSIDEKDEYVKVVYDTRKEPTDERYVEYMYSIYLHPIEYNGEDLYEEIDMITIENAIDNGNRLLRTRKQIAYFYVEKELSYRWYPPYQQIRVYDSLDHETPRKKNRIIRKKNRISKRYEKKINKEIKKQN